MLKTISAKVFGQFIGVLILAALAGCGGGGSGTTTPANPGPVVTPPPVPSSISLSATLTSIKSDNSNSTSVTAIVLDSANAVISGVAVVFSADTGVLSSATAITDSSGKATVTFSSGTTNASSRTATITATAGTKTAQIPIRLTGSTIDLVATGTNLIAGGAATNLTITLKNASSVPVSGAAITLTSSGAGTVVITPTSGTSDANGQFVVTVRGTVAGQVTVTVSALGEIRTLTYLVSSSSTAFSITTPATDVVGTTLNTPLQITVQATSPAANVVFASTVGTWDNSGRNSITKQAVNGVVTATLTSTVAGVASVLVYDASTGPGGNLSDTLTVAFTAANAFKISLQAQPTIVAPSSGGATGVSSLLATVTDAAGNPVGNAAVTFQILTPTGGGETVTPAVVQTASVPGGGVALGQAKATFTSGSLPSGARGVQVRASVLGTNVATEQVYPVAIDVTPSGPDASIVIGGTAGSVTIGRATVVSDNSNNTAYILPMSVLIADSNGNAVANATVSLSAWPVAFNVGTNSVLPGGVVSTCNLAADYYNEDQNENLVLDPGEDGMRRLYPNGAFVLGGTVDGSITPPNSASGTLPATVQTDASGLATFNLTYTKANSIWITTRIRASTFVQGTETVGQVIFRLPASIPDVGPPCLIPSSPYRF